MISSNGIKPFLGYGFSRKGSIEELLEHEIAQRIERNHGRETWW